MYKILILEKNNYWRENFSINFLSFSVREFFCGLASSSTAAQHNCHDEPSFNFNSLEILTGAEVKEVISSICSRVSHSSLSKKSSSTFERRFVAIKSLIKSVSSKDIFQFNVIDKTIGLMERAVSKNLFDFEDSTYLNYFFMS